MDKHLDMEALTQHILANRAEETAHRAICQGDKKAMAELVNEGSVAVRFDPEQEAPLGPRQVESLLCFMVSPEVSREIATIECDNIVYDALGEHRILGKKKKKKKKAY